MKRRANREYEMKRDSTSNVDLEKFPELKSLCWDINGAVISRRNAFNVYIDRWGHVHSELLSPEESSLIWSLTNEFGRGLFFPRAHGRSVIAQSFEEVTISEDDIDDKYVDQFRDSVLDHSYPGRRNGTLYFWRSDYEKFISQTKTKD